MGFPIYYKGKILFRNGKPAFSVDCCCDDPCIVNCGAEFQGVLYEVSTLFISPSSNSINWSFNDGITSMVFSQIGLVESLGNCNFRVLGSYIIVEPPDFSNAPIEDYVYGSYRNGIWSFSGRGFSMSFEAPPILGGDQIFVGNYQINFVSTMNPCGF
jgi:hypothetical protein